MNFGPLNFIFSTPFDGISSGEQRTGQNNLPLFLSFKNTCNRTKKKKTAHICVQKMHHC